MIPPDERARLRSFGDAAPGLARVLDELERVEGERDAASCLLGECITLATINTLAGDAPANEPNHAATCAVMRLVRERDEARDIAMGAYDKQAIDDSFAEIGKALGQGDEEDLADAARRVMAEVTDSARLLRGELTDAEVEVALFSGAAPVGLAIQLRIPQLRETFVRLKSERDAAFAVRTWQPAPTTLDGWRALLADAETAGEWVLGRPRDWPEETHHLVFDAQCDDCEHGVHWNHGCMRGETVAFVLRIPAPPEASK